ncbi:hypothetical protein [Algicella marina]|uniref:Ribosomal protein L7/L12 C-terminal domain-containing protein n=1 Tax=Algicella marina TaxID=2683284 RepID=A0A6P1T118_9RHOB|nr:hypothetical protein [Algicella marina]QHQ34222.1 hypothetical protein GO499_02960 [Algicella marina]
MMWIAIAAGIVVVLLVAGQFRPSRRVGDGMPATGKGLTPELRREIEAMLAARRMIPAIRLYRQATGAGLKDAKEAVEAIGRGNVPGPISRDHTGASAEIEAALAKGRVIDAIRLYREEHGVGLKEAKDAIDAMRKERG